MRVDTCPSGRSVEISSIARRKSNEVRSRKISAPDHAQVIGPQIDSIVGKDTWNIAVCAQITSTEAGGTLELTTCDGTDAQSFNFAREDTIVPTSAPEMCLTAVKGPCSGRRGAGTQTRSKYSRLKPATTRGRPIRIAVCGH